MDKVKQYLLKNFEQAFVLLTLLATAGINYMIPQKIAFLNFYFLPIILAGYYLGRRKAVLGAVLCMIFIGFYVWYNPEQFRTPASMVDIAVHVGLWGCFLILAGAVVGRLQENLGSEIQTTLELNKELEKSEAGLKEANAQLRDHTVDLEKAVKSRTDELEQSKRTTEQLKSKVEEALYATMDPSVVKLMIEGRLRNEKRTLSILFSDLVGFTTYSEDLPPEVVIRDLNRYLSEVEPILMAYHGHIDKYLGDGVMCEFGAPLDFEMHRLLAVMAGLKLQEKMAASDFPWKMRVGIASGSTITGLIGSKRQTYTAIGDVVNLGSRLESTCPAGKVLIDRYTNEGIERFVETRKFRKLSSREGIDEAAEDQLEKAIAALTESPNDPALLFEAGKAHAEVRDMAAAVGYFEQALQLDPENTELKLAYADAGMKAKGAEGIQVKGKRHRVEAYEVVGLKDPLANRGKLPQALVDEHGAILKEVGTPEDVILPVEAIDGSIGHSKVVALLAYAIAEELKINDVEKLDILNAAFIADIGKQAVPHHLLNRAGSLTTNEFDLATTHPMEGAKLLRNMGYDNDNIVKMVMHSHEAFNGTGRPDGLKGTAIPIGSRIIAVADAYDALTAWRPYREAWDRRAAMDEIHRNVKKGLYEPEIVEILDRLTG